MITKKIRVYGIVQGVGFRPTVSRHAAAAGITGSVCNKGPYVEIFAQGEEKCVKDFLERLEKQPPKRAAILQSDTEDVKESVEESIPAASLTLENSDTSESETKVEQAEAVDRMAVIAIKTSEEKTVEELQTAILGKMANNGPVTEDMKRTVAENIWHDSLVNWLKSFR